MDAIFSLSEEKLLTDGWSPRIVSLLKQAHDLNPAEEIVKNCIQNKIIPLSLENKLYPPLLKTVYDPPAVLYVRGNTKLLAQKPTLAVVGSRSMTSYGRTVLEQLLPDCIAAGVPVVSGLALGTDAAAHHITIREGGQALAVLGGGCDDCSIQPRSNVRLGQEVLHHNGILISEYPPGTLPAPHNFPQRNRIIAGLSTVILISEAAKKSGALITAQYGLENSREVAAIPGPITAPFSLGTNILIGEGAHQILTSEDLLCLLDVKKPQDLNPETLKTLSPDSLQLVTLVRDGAQHIDEIIIRSGQTPAVVMQLLTELTLDGVLHEAGSDTYVLGKI